MHMNTDKPKDLVPISYEQEIEVLKGNTFGILESEGTTEEKIKRLLNLLPMAFEIVDEARSTIERLREENERLRNGEEPQDQLLLQSYREEESELQERSESGEDG